MSIINAWLKANPATGGGGVRDRLVTKDGASISVQASRWHRSVPVSDTGPWTHVEVHGPVSGGDPTPGPAKPVRAHITMVDLWIILHGGIAHPNPNPSKGTPNDRP